MACRVHQTFTIEGIDADLRADLGRLKRRSRCFSRSAVQRAETVWLFVWHDNRRQRLIIPNPAYRGTLPLLFSPLPTRSVLDANRIGMVSSCNST